MGGTPLYFLPLTARLHLRRRWETTTDVMPIVFFLPALVHWAVIIAAAVAVFSQQDLCPHNAARAAYQTLRLGLFVNFVLIATVEVGIVVFGCQGEVLLYLPSTGSTETYLAIVHGYCWVACTRVQGMPYNSNSNHAMCSMHHGMPHPGVAAAVKAASISISPE